MNKIEEKAEDILGKFLEKMNPINLHTGEKYTPSLEQFQSAWDKAVKSIITFTEKKNE